MPVAAVLYSLKKTRGLAKRPAAARKPSVKDGGSSTFATAVSSSCIRIGCRTERSGRECWSRGACSCRAVAWMTQLVRSKVRSCISALEV